MATPLQEIGQLGQSIWYDNMSRGLLDSGGFAKLIRDGVVGCTSNPAIFAIAMGKSQDYDAALKQLLAKGIRDPKTLYEHLAIEDIQRAADLLRPIYESTQGIDGMISLEVSPHLAHDTAGTIAEAVRLRQAVDRPNVMIKVPATEAGFPAIANLVGQGLHINITLLFSVSNYEKVAEAYMTGLEQRLSAGKQINNLTSVASFFVSRIDTLVDDKISKPGGLLEKTTDPARKEKLKSLLGQVATANAYIAYEKYLQLEAGPRWQKLAAAGARPQRLLWASTSTKNPAYPKTKYVDALLVANTVDTIPQETIDAIMASPGVKRRPFTESWPQPLKWAESIITTLHQCDIALRDVTDELIVEAVKKFSDPFDQLLAGLEQKAKSMGAK
jgi:transaldolase/glucose-6-phosphate isomerase